MIISSTSTRLSPLELQTVLFECANLVNERPLGVLKTPREDGTFKVLTPNSLLIGRSLGTVPDDISLRSHLKKSDRYELIQQATSEFWSHWSQQVTPERIIRQKWHQVGRNLRIGDVVLLHDKSPIKGRYILGLVVSVNLGRDGMVRSCTVSYTVTNKKDPLGKYSGGTKVKVTRSVQRLTLLLPVEEQENTLEVSDNVVKTLEDQSVV